MHGSRADQIDFKPTELDQIFLAAIVEMVLVEKVLIKIVLVAVALNESPMRCFY